MAKGFGPGTLIPGTPPGSTSGQELMAKGKGLTYHGCLYGASRG